MLVIIPSNREITLSYLTPLIEYGARFIIVDDTPGSITIDHPQFRVYNWEDRKKMLGPLDVAIPKRTGASMVFGFFIAWQEAEDDEIIITFGDDCEVTDSNFPMAVENALSHMVRPEMKGQGLHLNILNLYEDVSKDLFPRGFPYAARATNRPCTLGPEVSSTADFNLGLWQGAFDVNAVDKISGPEWYHPEARLKSDSTLVPPKALVSVCSMNMQFRKFLIPAVYQLPMHVKNMEHWVIDRYGDIWGGFILKILMDIAGHRMAVGSPMIRHNKIHGYERNLWQEHITHFVNDEFIDLLLESSLEVKPAGYVSMLGDLHEGMARRSHNCSVLLKPYVQPHLLDCLGAWIEIFSRSN